VNTLALQSLVERALADIARTREAHPTRRPGWAPPLIFPEELAETLEALQGFFPTEPIFSTYGRLWLRWKNRSWLRLNHAKYTRASVLGFHLRAGKEPNGKLLLELSLGSDSEWQIGPKWVDPVRYRNFAEPGWTESREIFRLAVKARQLSLEAILAFASDPDEIMRRSARLAGICCVCGRTLTDPTSREQGIGPECRGFHYPFCPL
jgi:hypothetical protein